MSNTNKQIFVAEDSPGASVALSEQLKQYDFQPLPVQINCAEQCWYDEPLDLSTDSAVLLLIFSFLTPNHFALLSAFRERFPSLMMVILCPTEDAQSLERIFSLGQVELLSCESTAALVAQALSRASQKQTLERDFAHCQVSIKRLDRELGEHVSALRRDQTAAQKIQQNLLPITPLQLSSVVARYWLRPSLYLSGDFVDYGIVRRSFLPFYLADVSGHGASSAFVTVWLKQLVRRYFERADIFRRSKCLAADLQSLVEGINQQMMRSRFFCNMTCCFGAIDLRSNTLHYLTAGHLPRMILLSDGKARYLEGTGPAMGIFDNAVWQLYHIELPEIYTVLAFSDGILEVLPQTELSSKEEYLLELVADCHGDQDAIRERLAIDGHDSIPDDISMLSLECVGGR